MNTATNKKRCENWALEDKMLLQELVKERVRILENTNSDTNSNARKVAAWADLHNSFNIMRTGAPRTIAQLKNQWGSLKLGEKRKKSLENKLRLKTGGGPPPRQDPTDSNDISAWLPDEFVIDTNEFDSDSVNQALVLVEETEAANALPVTSPGAAGAGPSSTPPPFQANDNEITPDLVVPEEAEVLEVPQARRAPRATPRGTKRKIHKPAASLGQPAANIAATEIRCRTELHGIQMENEQRIKRNLELKEQLLKTKIAYFEKKNTTFKISFDSKFRLLCSFSI